MVPFHFLPERLVRNAGGDQFVEDGLQRRSEGEAVEGGEAIRRKLDRKNLLEVRLNPVGAHVMKVADIGSGQGREFEIAIAALGKLRVE
jgi:hypothetical protein